MDCEKIFSLFFNKSSDLLILLSGKMIILDINISAEDVLKWKKKYVCNQKIETIFKKYETEPFIGSTIPSKSFEKITEIYYENKKLMINWKISILNDTNDNEVILVEGKRLKEESNQLNYLLKYAPGLVYWKDTNSVYQGCNDEFARLAGLKSRSEVIGKTDFDLMWKEGAPYYTADDLQVLKTGKSKLNIEEIIATSDNKKATVLSNKVALLDDKNIVVGIMGITTDITIQKELEEDLRLSKKSAENANQAKTEFLANMRHDIRTSLSGIIGFSEILKQKLSDPKFKEYAQNLVVSAQSLHVLMDEILESIIVSTGEIPMLKKKFSLPDTLTSITQLYAAKAAEKQLALTLSIDEALPKFIIGDRIRFHRIVLELVGNALNFTKDGYVAIQVELAQKEQQSIVIRLVVDDTGIGIAEEKQQDIYVQFKRLTPSYQGIYKGAGLGLSIVKQFIDELGGEIYVESKKRKGTKFSCLIPMHLPLINDATNIEPISELVSLTPDSTFLATVTLSEETPPNNDKASRVLVVEDNFLAQTVIKTMLADMSCHVDTASSGKDALDFCETHDYDLIFMDVGLGEGLDGCEVTQYIRSKMDKKPNLPHLPIIALTAHAAEESRQRCIKAGMDAVLAKPLTQSRAMDILNNFIPARRQQPIIELDSKRQDLPDKDEEMFQLSQFSLLSIEDALVNCGTKEFLTELLQLMLTDLPIDLEKMKEAYTNQDHSKVEKIAHKIKGGAVYVGTNRMKYACQYLERYVKSGQDKLFNALYQQAVSTIEETITYTEKHNFFVK